MSLHAIRADLIQAAPEYCWRIIGVGDDGKEYTKGFIWKAADGYTAMVRYHQQILKGLKAVMDEFEEEQHHLDRQAERSNALMASSSTAGATK